VQRVVWDLASESEVPRLPLWLGCRHPHDAFSTANKVALSGRYFFIAPQSDDSMSYTFAPITMGSEGHKLVGGGGSHRFVKGCVSDTTLCHTRGRVANGSADS